MFDKKIDTYCYDNKVKNKKKMKNHAIMKSENACFKHNLEPFFVSGTN